MVLEEMLRSNSGSNLRFLQFRVAWPDIISSCNWEDASIVLQLGFLGIVLLHCVRNCTESLCRGRNKVKNVEKNPTGLRSGLSYKLSIICSLVVLCTHCVILLILLILESKSAAQCESRVPVLSSRTMQIISWAITLIALCRILNRKYNKFPWILRIWWTSSFLLSLVRAMIDVHHAITNHDNLGVQEYADIVSFLASICLLGVSINGSTGIAPSISNSTTEPLLNGRTEKHSEVKRDCPYGKATLVQLVTFSWLNSLFETGIKKPLDQDEVPDIDIKDSASFLSLYFDECLKHTKEKDGTTRSSIYRAIYIFARKRQPSMHFLQLQMQEHRM